MVWCTIMLLKMVELAVKTMMTMTIIKQER